MCPHCRAFITISDKVCPYCGERVGPRAIERGGSQDFLAGFIPHARFNTVLILVINFGLYLATAVQAVNDLVAIGAANTFLSQGLRIPEQLSIVGFGNILTAEHYRVPLTTIRQPKYRLGEAAMDAMQRLLRGQRPEPRRLHAEIIVRNSTAPPMSR